MKFVIQRNHVVFKNFFLKIFFFDKIRSFVKKENISTAFRYFYTRIRTWEPNLLKLLIACLLCITGSYYFRAVLAKFRNDGKSIKVKFLSKKNLQAKFLVFNIKKTSSIDFDN